jgi:DNA replication licensing factor MCM2
LEKERLLPNNRMVQTE